MITASQQKAINKAMNIIRETMATYEVTLTSPEMVKNYLVMKLANEKKEVFVGLFLNNRHQLIADVVLAEGTIDGASVHPREVVRKAIELNAAAIIFSHNHPSGVPDPSAADQRLTERLHKALSLIDCRVLDHIIVGGDKTVSFAERGLL